MAVSGMAGLDSSFGFVDAQLSLGYRTSTLLVEDDNYNTINDLDTRLSTLDAGTYTVAYLRMLTKNDKIYALRLLRDAASI